MSTDDEDPHLQYPADLGSHFDGVAPKRTIEDKQAIEKSELFYQPDFLKNAAYTMLQFGSAATVDNVKDMVAAEWKRFAVGQEIADPATANFARDHLLRHQAWKESELGHALSHESPENIDLSGLTVFFCTNYLPWLSESGQHAYIPTTLWSTDFQALRTTIHTTLNHVVRPVTSGGRHFSWEKSRYVLMAPLQSVIAENGSPYTMLPEDTWWALGTSLGLKLPSDTVLIAQSGDETVAAITNVPGLTVRSVKGLPYQAAESIAEGMGTDTLSNPRMLHECVESIANQLNAFVGHHNASLSGRGSESYVRAEAVLRSGTDGAIERAIHAINSARAEVTRAERKDQALYLFNQGYFDGMRRGASIFPTYHSDYVRSLIADFLHGRKTDYPLSQSLLDASRRVETLIDQGLSENTEWPLMSDSLLRQKLSRINEHLPIIPPQLLGTFFMVYADALGLRAKPESASGHTHRECRRGVQNAESRIGKV